jgi:hypothetical protein
MLLLLDFKKHTAVKQLCIMQRFLSKITLLIFLSNANLSMQDAECTPLCQTVRTCQQFVLPFLNGFQFCIKFPMYTTKQTLNFYPSSFSCQSGSSPPSSSTITMGSCCSCLIPSRHDGLYTAPIRHPKRVINAAVYTIHAPFSTFKAPPPLAIRQKPVEEVPWPQRRDRANDASTRWTDTTTAGERTYDQLRPPLPYRHVLVESWEE